jgi:DNA-binding NtrC family response regulator
MSLPKVLIVDDEEEFLSALSERLERRGIAVRTALSGAECLSALEQEPSDVVVLDVRMPGISGVDTLSHIKKRFPDIEVIMLSGHADTATAIHGMELGAFDYLVKPVHIDELIYRIQDAHRTSALKSGGDDVADKTE